MKSSTIFTKAARYISLQVTSRIVDDFTYNPDGCCDSIYMVGAYAGDMDRAYNVFKELYKPKEWCLYWWDSPFKNENQEARIIALLFAAEYAKSIGD